jgi:hypothetical protein
MKINVYCLLQVLVLYTLSSQAQAILPVDNTNGHQTFQFVYPDATTDPYLQKLKQENQLGQLVHHSLGDLRSVLALTNWTHSLWKHNGSNEPSGTDALTIIREAKEGKNFRCVEYAKVSADALLSVGMKARVLNLKTKDAETRKSGAGHVLTEVWLPVYQKWAVADAQFNLVPVSGGIPLNAVELQQAIASKQNIEFHDINGPVKEAKARKYLNFISPYLYFFDAELDQREVPYTEKTKADKFSSVMLVPSDAQAPKIFQRRFPLDYMLFTDSINDFYQAPE